MIATMPEFLAFKDDDEKKFFIASAAITTIARELTQFPERPSFTERRLGRA